MKPKTVLCPPPAPPGPLSHVITVVRHTHTLTHTLLFNIQLDSTRRVNICAVPAPDRGRLLTSVLCHQIMKYSELVREKEWREWEWDDEKTERERERLRAVALLVIIIVIKVLVVFRNVPWWYHVYEDTGLRYDKQWIPEIRVLQQHSYVTLVLHFSIKIIKNQWIYSTSQKYTIN